MRQSRISNICMHSQNEAYVGRFQEFLGCAREEWGKKGRGRVRYEVRKDKERQVERYVWLMPWSVNKQANEQQSILPNRMKIQTCTNFKTVEHKRSGRLLGPALQYRVIRNSEKFCKNTLVFHLLLKQRALWLNPEKCTSEYRIHHKYILYYNSQRVTVKPLAPPSPIRGALEPLSVSLRDLPE